MEEFDLKQMFRWYVKKWWALALGAILGVGLGFAYNHFQTPMYESSANVIVLQRPSGVSSDILMKTYVEIVKSRRIANESARELGDDISASEIQNVLSAQNEKGTEVMTIKVSTQDAEKSRRIAEASLNSFSNILEELYKIDPEFVQVIGVPMAAAKASNVNIPKQYSVAIMSSVVATVVVMFFIYDAKRASLSEVEKKYKTKLQKKEEEAIMKEYEARIEEAQARIDISMVQKSKKEAQAFNVEALKSEAKKRSAQAEIELLESQNKKRELELEQARLDEEQRKVLVQKAAKELSLKEEKKRIANEARVALTQSRDKSKIDTKIAKEEAKILAKARLRITQMQSDEQIRSFAKNLEIKQQSPMAYRRTETEPQGKNTTVL